MTISKTFKLSSNSILNACDTRIYAHNNERRVWYIGINICLDHGDTIDKVHSDNVVEINHALQSTLTRYLNDYLKIT